MKTWRFVNHHCRHLCKSYLAKVETTLPSLLTTKMDLRYITQDRIHPSPMHACWHCHIPAKTGNQLLFLLRAYSKNNIPQRTELNLCIVSAFRVGSKQKLHPKWFNPSLIPFVGFPVIPLLDCDWNHERVNLLQVTQFDHSLFVRVVLLTVECWGLHSPL